MKFRFFILFLSAFLKLSAQINTASAADTTIYGIAERQASFPGCDYSWYSDKEKDSCRMVNLMRFVSSNLRYPEAARNNNISGRVVVKFVIEKDGSVSNASLLKDIRDGCGAEALRIINGMNGAGVKWNPGQIHNLPIRSFLTLPIVFRLNEDPSYNVVDGYKVYYNLDKPLRLKDTTSNLADILKKNLKTPRFINDSCKVGAMQTEILVFPDGTAKALVIDDFSNLGTDAQFAAIEAVTATVGLWNVAEFKGKAVPTNVTTRVVFKPDAPKCKAAIANFDKAYKLLEEGADLTGKKQNEPAILKLTEAIKLLPNNMEFYYTRGIIYTNLNKKEEACADLTKVKQVLNVNWVDSLLPFLCQ
jgi:TonB family protein